MKKIPVKTGWDTLLFVSLTLLPLFYFTLKEPNTVSVAVLAGIVAFILYVMFSIQYFVEEHFLIIRNTFFQTIRIDISTITKIESTSNLISSPAPSLSGRIEIHYKEGNVIISPADKNQFKQILLEINPEIEFKL